MMPRVVKEGQENVKKRALHEVEKSISTDVLETVLGRCLRRAYIFDSRDASIVSTPLKTVECAYPHTLLRVLDDLYQAISNYITHQFISLFLQVYTIICATLLGQFHSHSRFAETSKLRIAHMPWRLAD